MAFSQTQSAEQAFKERIALFDYDAKADLGIKVLGSEKRGSVTINDISFIGVPGKDSVKAYLVMPEGAGPFAGILWTHWLGRDKANRSQYLDESVALAPGGAVSLLIDAMWAAPNWYESRVPEKDYENSIRQVIEIRRAMDVLASQSTVDRARIGFVGHDYGGMYGALAAGVDRRAKAYVFIAVTSSLSGWAFFAAQPESKVDYIRRNAVFELTDFIAPLKGASFLFQWSKTDPFISLTDGSVFFEAAPEPKERKLYDSNHEMGDKAISTDRDAWLVRELML